MWSECEANVGQEINGRIRSRDTGIVWILMYAGHPCAASLYSFETVRKVKM